MTTERPWLRAPWRVERSTMGIRVVWGEPDPETGYSDDVPGPDGFRCGLLDSFGSDRAEQIVWAHNSEATG